MPGNMVLTPALNLVPSLRLGSSSARITLISLSDLRPKFLTRRRSASEYSSICQMYSTPAFCRQFAARTESSSSSTRLQRFGESTQPMALPTASRRSAELELSTSLAICSIWPLSPSHIASTLTSHSSSLAQLSVSSRTEVLALSACTRRPKWLLAQRLIWRIRV